uniref:Serine aminopeptidase S33 domain-containing protein n=1 Tax=Rhodosorus marinus TaxID=101924 RepID=A0A7S3EJE2_9RHOD|mmetsp:Transcript_40943/g.162136  ORF Transcript_40943/g.162136 Transcript_40943/m.162136 type:complete len:283 (+) Transcript_40943:50-898(+)
MSSWFSRLEMMKGVSKTIEKSRGKRGVRRVWGDEVGTYFKPRRFEPAWWAWNAHIQTLASYFISTKAHARERRVRLNTPDGDFIDVDVVDGTTRRDTAVLVCHGLESSAAGSLPRRLAAKFNRSGWTVYSINLRGCSGVVNKHLRALHLGFTDDLRLLVEYAKRNGAKRIYIAGYSLGGNITLKLLGELQEKAIELGVHGGVAFSVPFGAYESAHKLQNSSSSWIYMNAFLLALKKKVAFVYSKLTPQFKEKGLNLLTLLTATSIIEFDEQYTCKCELHARN